MKDALANLKIKSMDRRGFLVLIGSALLTVLGVSAFLKALLHGPATPPGHTYTPTSSYGRDDGVIR
jgi:hypothetical protein